MITRHVPSECRRSTSVAIEAILTGLSSGPVPLKDHSLITRARSAALITLFTLDSNLPYQRILACFDVYYLCL